MHGGMEAETGRDLEAWRPSCQRQKLLTNRREILPQQRQKGPLTNETILRSFQVYLGKHTPQLKHRHIYYKHIHA